MKPEKFIFYFVSLLLLFVLAEISVSIYMNKASFEWEHVKAEVLSITYIDKSVNVVYFYEKKGDKYTNNRISYISLGTLEDRDFMKNKAVEVGHKIDIFVDPRENTNSVILRKKLRFKHVQFHILLVFVVGVSFFKSRGC